MSFIHVVLLFASTTLSSSRCFFVAFFTRIIKSSLALCSASWISWRTSFANWRSFALFVELSNCATSVSHAHSLSQRDASMRYSSTAASVASSSASSVVTSADEGATRKRQKRMNCSMALTHGFISISVCTCSLLPIANRSTFRYLRCSAMGDRSSNLFQLTGRIYYNLVSFVSEWHGLLQNPIVKNKIFFFIC